MPGMSIIEYPVTTALIGEMKVHQDNLKEQVAGFQDVMVERFDAMDVLDD